MKMYVSYGRRMYIHAKSNRNVPHSLTAHVYAGNRRVACFRFRIFSIVYFLVFKKVFKILMCLW